MNFLPDIGIAAGILLALGIGWALWKHPQLFKPAASQSPADIWDAIKTDLPSIISAEVQDLTAARDAAIARADKAEADLATERQASAVRLEAVKTQVTSVVAGISAAPAAAIMAAAPQPVALAAEPPAPVPAGPL